MENGQTAEMEIGWNSPIEVPSLQNLALNEFVHRLWHVTLTNNRQNGTLSDLLGNSTRSYSFSCCLTGQTFTVKFPGSNIKILPAEPLNIITEIKIKMERRLSNLKLNFENWLDQHVKYFSFHCNDPLNYILNNFDEFVYDYENDIDYGETAKNMISGTNFNSMDKFIIASVYCFEEKVELFWPFVMQDMSEKVTEYQPLLWYVPLDWCNLVWHWCHRMSNPNQDYTHDYRILAGHVVDNKSAMEYFWNKLNGENQCSVVLSIFYYDHKPRSRLQNIRALINAKYLFPKLNATFLRRIGMTFGQQLMITLIKNATLWKFAIPIWLRVKDFIRDFLFAVLSQLMLHVEIPCNTSDYQPRKFNEEHEMADITEDYFVNLERKLIRQIWNSASARLKAGALSYNGNLPNWFEINE